MVAPGSRLDAGQAVRWSFEADRALNFNDHYHVDKEVRYPAKKENVKRLQGDLSVDSRQDYCWMWTNKTTVSTKLPQSRQELPLCHACLFLNPSDVTAPLWTAAWLQE